MATPTVKVNAANVHQALGRLAGTMTPPSLHAFLQGPVNTYFADLIVNRFAGHGDRGTPGGSWAPLEESTIRIRHALGFFDDEATNERTGELLEYVAYSRGWEYFPGGAAMSIPEGNADPILEKKFLTAQEGAVQGPGEMFPGAVTPARPVLTELTADDHAAVLALLSGWIATHV